ncbi:P-loop containing nucleoside triphosphate hydrolase protein [Schizophyllum amplum]|uniref:P-loop containing nucleoside triphosphate hydrolase protein n=1 Tax=Schizophyllum amplum TaxID=97359 RepID=A0A550CDS5_9AGAR|nr:P-loop containing nucleoside triphosphate hydrolase protein [Auriculariopsis ampla]
MMPMGPPPGPPPGGFGRGKPGRHDGGPRRKGTFNPEDEAKVIHSKLGVWDFYQEKAPQMARLPSFLQLESYLEIIPSFPYVVRMLRDIASIRDCQVYMLLYLALEIVAALVPAISLWYSGQLLRIVQVAVDERAVDTEQLFRVASGRFACSIAERLLRHAKSRVGPSLNKRIKQHYAIHTFRSLARLDVPTFDDAAVQTQLQQSVAPNSRTTIAWNTVTMALNILSTALRLASQFLVLARVLVEQRDGVLLASLSFAQSLFSIMNFKKDFGLAGGEGLASDACACAELSPVWAATTKDADYIRTEGLKKTISSTAHRKEIVAGGLWQYMLQAYADGIKRLGPRAGDFFDIQSELRTRDRLTLFSLLAEPLKELPQIVFTLRAVQFPSSIPVSLASLNLITQTTTEFTMVLYRLFEQTGSIAEKFASVRKMYEVASIPNRVPDGRERFPEDRETLRMGVEVEFRDVGFRYAGSEAWALRHVSFRVGRGQLCVILGANGSGKSTALKLISRVYDPTEGEIFIDGKEIRQLKLDDLRRAISVLFQDYTLFPLNIRDNIALGDPEAIAALASAEAHGETAAEKDSGFASEKDSGFALEKDSEFAPEKGSQSTLANNPSSPANPIIADIEERVRDAARLGGADGFLAKLPEGYDTYLDPPVKDHYAGLPEGTKSLFGRPVSYGRMRGMGGMSSAVGSGLSGGQVQRVALSRTFMRSNTTEPRVGLLLFDEPSASLDPVAEHDLFERLRQLRGNKTMIFSSHRFGNLTRHADVILYMNDSVVVEAGTHDELLRRGGDYARIWNLQAQAFM